MKILVILAVIALLIVTAIFYFGGGELAIIPKATPTPGAAPADAKQNYTALSSLLTQDMGNIPALLTSPRVSPTNAFSVKSRLAGAAAVRPEYQTLADVCDLIIYADQEHSVRQAQDKQNEQTVSGDLMATARTNQLSTAAARLALHGKAQADWESYRRQTEAEVHRLLGTLPQG